MAGDPFKRVIPGQPLEISAASWNAMLDAARAHRERQVSQGGPVKTERNYTTCLVKNNSGGAVDRFGILAIGDPIILPTDSLEQFASTIAFEGDAPDGTEGAKWCVLLEPIPDGAIGLAVISGVIPVQVAAGSGAEDYVQTAAGDTEALGFSASGSALVLWEEGSGDPRWALVRLGDGAGSGASGVTVQEQDGSPSYTSTTTIQVNQADGLVLTQPSSNTVLVSIQDAGASQVGIVSTGTQTFAGAKNFEGVVTLKNNSRNSCWGSWYVGASVLAGDAYGAEFERVAYGFSCELQSVDGDFGDWTLETESGQTNVYFTLNKGADAADAFFRIRTNSTLYTGATGTDALGNQYRGGIIHTVGGGSIPTAYTDEQARDAIGAALVAGSGIGITVNDGADTITIACSVTQYTDEMARDALGTALTEGYLIDVAVNDGSDTITLEKKFRGARAYRSGSGAAPGYGSTWGSVAFDAENYDTDAIHDNSTNNSRFTIPTGMGGYWRFAGRIYPDSAGNVAGTVVQVRLLHNGTTVFDQIITEVEPSGSIPVSIVQSARSVSAGDYVELQMYHNGAGAMAYYNNDVLTWMECEFQGVAP